jgi:hypothetical protein
VLILYVMPKTKAEALAEAFRVRNYIANCKPHSKIILPYGGARAAVSIFSRISAILGEVINGMPPVGSFSLRYL